MRNEDLCDKSLSLCGKEKSVDREERVLKFVGKLRSQKRVVSFGGRGRGRSPVHETQFPAEGTNPGKTNSRRLVVSRASYRAIGA